MSNLKQVIKLIINKLTHIGDREEIVNSIVEWITDIYIFKENYTMDDGKIYVVEYSATYGHLELIKQLVNGTDNNVLDCALAVSAKYGHLEIFIYLMERGVDGRFALAMCAMNGHLEIVRYLIEK